MAQRDYVSRSRSGTRKKNSRKKKGSSGGASKLMIVLATAVLVIFAAGLYFITQHKPDTSPEVTGQPARPGNGLPPKPEERWTYIKELENRQVTNSESAQAKTPGISPQANLTPEQRQFLEQMQADMRQQPTQLAEVPSNATSRDGGAKPAAQQQTQTPAEQPKRTPPPVTPPPATPSTTQTAAQAQNQRWTIQCGSFKTTEQAESVKVSLAFAGFESRITASGGWNRVVLGPYNNKDGADKTLQRLKGAGVGNCIPVASGK
ncbi:cell division protein FtsN [Budvicia aquatica]|uniref:Cell division protein FtsN n=1 Tax=Budvicia aquatica TaxID=82979 RepID=A0A2C6DBK8_9GAMM|nr:cell division protein FtsN [Budvicia aquatica]MBP9641931.1 cell division protein FtsN [Budvicia sp.]PHI28596.1 cell division protein FtsN [Budvicia aquatica]VFS46584.1 Cell division protein FtsN [Budvicia aquatica]